MKIPSTHGSSLLRLMAGAGMACAVLVFFSGQAGAQATTYYPQKATDGERALLTNQSTGYVRIYVAGNWYRGSGVVARHPHLLYSAAHVISVEGTWAASNNIEFHRRLHRGTNPPYGGVSPRGFLHFSNYSGGNGAESYDEDLTVMYANVEFGPAAPYFGERGGEMVESDQLKKIVGYPRIIDALEDGDPDKDGLWYQHNTAAFPVDASLWNEDMQRFYRIDDVSTGHGNSGGPVFVEGESGVYALAAILVSGYSKSNGTPVGAGVHALDGAAHSMGTDALGRVELAPPSVTKTFKHRRIFRLPAGKSAFRKKSVRASGFHGQVDKLRFRARFKNPHGKKLEVYLKAPSGRFLWVVRGSKGRSKKIAINKDFSGTFRGSRANGAWRLFLRDPEKGKRAVLRMFSVTISD